MAFSLGPRLAEIWGVEYRSDEFFKRCDEARDRMRRWSEYVSRYPECELCGDSTYFCDCVESR